ncbi:MAG: hypothetical protein ACLSIR_11110 [Christensenellales bacterium]
MSRRKSAFPFTTQSEPCAVWPLSYFRRPAISPCSIGTDATTQAAVPSGAYTAALETVISGNRQKATVDLTVQ